jgi:hypothetical protein
VLAYAAEEAERLSHKFLIRIKDSNLEDTPFFARRRRNFPTLSLFPCFL